MIDKNYLDSRSEIEYDCHDELQMNIIVCKIVDELRRRYGDSVHLVGDERLKALVKHW